MEIVYVLWVCIQGGVNTCAKEVSIQQASYSECLAVSKQYNEKDGLITLCFPKENKQVEKEDETNS